MIENMFVLGCV